MEDERLQSTVEAFYSNRREPIEDDDAASLGIMDGADFGSPEGSTFSGSPLQSKHSRTAGGPTPGSFRMPGAAQSHTRVTPPSAGAAVVALTAVSATTAAVTVPPSFSAAALEATVTLQSAEAAPASSDVASVPLSPPHAIDACVAPTPTPHVLPSAAEAVTQSPSPVMNGSRAVTQSPSPVMSPSPVVNPFPVLNGSSRGGSAGGRAPVAAVAVVGVAGGSSTLGQGRAAAPYGSQGAGAWGTVTRVADIDSDDEDGDGGDTDGGERGSIPGLSGGALGGGGSGAGHQPIALHVSPPPKRPVLPPAAAFGPNSAPLSVTAAPAAHADASPESVAAGVAPVTADVAAASVSAPRSAAAESGTDLGTVAVGPAESGTDFSTASVVIGGEDGDAASPVAISTVLRVDNAYTATAPPAAAHAALYRGRDAGFSVDGDSIGSAPAAEVRAAVVELGDATPVVGTAPLDHVNTGSIGSDSSSGISDSSGSDNSGISDTVLVDPPPLQLPTPVVCDDGAPLLTTAPVPPADHSPDALLVAPVILRHALVHETTAAAAAAVATVATKAADRAVHSGEVVLTPQQHVTEAQTRVVFSTALPLPRYVASARTGSLQVVAPHSTGTGALLVLDPPAPPTSSGSSGGGRSRRNSIRSCGSDTSAPRSDVARIPSGRTGVLPAAGTAPAIAPIAAVAPFIAPYTAAPTGIHATPAVIATPADIATPAAVATPTPIVAVSIRASVASPERAPLVAHVGAVLTSAAVTAPASLLPQPAHLADWARPYPVNGLAPEAQVPSRREPKPHAVEAAAPMHTAPHSYTTAAAQSLPSVHSNLPPPAINISNQPAVGSRQPLPHHSLQQVPPPQLGAFAAPPPALDPQLTPRDIGDLGSPTPPAPHSLSGFFRSPLRDPKSSSSFHSPRQGALPHLAVAQLTTTRAAPSSADTGAPAGGGGGGTPSLRRLPEDHAMPAAPPALHTADGIWSCADASFRMREGAPMPSVVQRDTAGGLLLRGAPSAPPSPPSALLATQRQRPPAPLPGSNPPGPWGSAPKGPVTRRVLLSPRVRRSPVHAAAAPAMSPDLGAVGRAHGAASVANGAASLTVDGAPNAQFRGSGAAPVAGAIATVASLPSHSDRAAMTEPDRGGGVFPAPCDGGVFPLHGAPHAPVAKPLPHRLRQALGDSAAVEGVAPVTFADEPAPGDEPGLGARGGTLPAQASRLPLVVAPSVAVLPIAAARPEPAASLLAAAAHFPSTAAVSSSIGSSGGEDGECVPLRPSASQLAPAPRLPLPTPLHHNHATSPTAPSLEELAQSSPPRVSDRPLPAGTGSGDGGNVTSVGGDCGSSGNVISGDGGNVTSVGGDCGSSGNVIDEGGGDLRVAVQRQLLFPSGNSASAPAVDESLGVESTHRDHTPTGTGLHRVPTSAVATTAPAVFAADPPPLATAHQSELRSRRRQVPWGHAPMAFPPPHPSPSGPAAGVGAESPLPPSSPSALLAHLRESIALADALLLQQQQGLAGHRQHHPGGGVLLQQTQEGRSLFYHHPPAPSPSGGLVDPGTTLRHRAEPHARTPGAPHRFARTPGAPFGGGGGTGDDSCVGGSSLSLAGSGLSIDALAAGIAAKIRGAASPPQLNGPGLYPFPGSPAPRTGRRGFPPSAPSASLHRPNSDTNAQAQQRRPVAAEQQEPTGVPPAVGSPLPHHASGGSVAAQTYSEQHHPEQATSSSPGSGSGGDGMQAAIFSLGPYSSTPAAHAVSVSAQPNPPAAPTPGTPTPPAMDYAADYDEEDGIPDFDEMIAALRAGGAGAPHHSLFTTEAAPVAPAVAAGSGSATPRRVGAVGLLPSHTHGASEQPPAPLPTSSRRSSAHHRRRGTGTSGSGGLLLHNSHQSACDASMSETAALLLLAERLTAVALAPSSSSVPLSAGSGPTAVPLATTAPHAVPSSYSEELPGLAPPEASVGATPSIGMPHAHTRVLALNMPGAAFAPPTAAAPPATVPGTRAAGGAASAPLIDGPVEVAELGLGDMGLGAGGEGGWDSGHLHPMPPQLHHQLWEGRLTGDVPFGDLFDGAAVVHRGTGSQAPTPRTSTDPRISAASSIAGSVPPPAGAVSANAKYVSAASATAPSAGGSGGGGGMFSLAVTRRLSAHPQEAHAYSLARTDASDAIDSGDVSARSSLAEGTKRVSQPGHADVSAPGVEEPSGGSRISAHSEGTNPIGHLSSLIVSSQGDDSGALAAALEAMLSVDPEVDLQVLLDMLAEGGTVGDVGQGSSNGAQNSVADRIDATTAATHATAHPPPPAAPRTLLLPPGDAAAPPAATASFPAPSGPAPATNAPVPPVSGAPIGALDPATAVALLSALAAALLPAQQPLPPAAAPHPASLNAIEALQRAIAAAAVALQPAGLGPAPPAPSASLPAADRPVHYEGHRQQQQQQHHTAGFRTPPRTPARTAAAHGGDPTNAATTAAAAAAAVAATAGEHGGHHQPGQAGVGSGAYPLRPRSPPPAERGSSHGSSHGSGQGRESPPRPRAGSRATTARVPSLGSGYAPQALAPLHPRSPGATASAAAGILPVTPPGGDPRSSSGSEWGAAAAGEGATGTLRGLPRSPASEALLRGLMQPQQ